MRLNGYLIRSTVVAALGGLLFGFDTAVIAGTTNALSELFDLSPALLGFTVSVALWGTVAGSIAAGYPGDRWGRRDSLRIMATLFFVSAAGCAIAWDWYSLLFFRFVGGLGVGGASVLGPMYIAEIAPAKWRGRLVGFFQFNVVFGIVVAYFSNYVVGSFGLGEAEWRWKLGIEALPAALFFVMLFGIPRSPRWLVKQGRVDAAREVLTLTGDPALAGSSRLAAEGQPGLDQVDSHTDVHRDPKVEQELRDIVESIDAEHHRGVEPLFKLQYKIPIFLAVSIAAFNQLTGINAILYYLNDIFAEAGFDKVSSDLQAVAVGSMNILATAIAMVVIDKVGRRVLMLIGSVGTALCLAGIAAILITGQRQDKLVYLLVTYMLFFASSQGAVIWVYISEVFPNRVRAKGQSLGSFTHWFANAIISGTFPMLAAASGGYPFVFFSAMMALQFFVVLFLYPETKGITLERMQKRLGIS